MKIARFGTLFALIALLCTAPAAAVQISTIALTGVDDSRGPGMGPGVAYLDLVTDSPLLVPGAGQTDIYFGALIEGGQGVRMRHDGMSPTPVLASGTPAPGLPAGALMTSFGTRPLATANGNIAQTVNLSGTGITSANNRAWLVGDPVSPNVIQKGNVAPGTGGALFNSLDEGPETYSTGGHTFLASLSGPGVNSANDLTFYYSANGTNLELVSRESAPVPGLAGVSYQAGSIPVGWVAGSSTVYFMTGLQGPGITSANDEYTLAWSSGGQATVLAGNGLAVPGIAGATYVGEQSGDQRNVGVVPDGSVLLGAAVTGGVFGAGTTNTILAGNASGLSNAIPLGATVPGTAVQLTGGRLPMVGDNDTFAFMGDMSDGTSGIMVMDAGNLRLVMANPLGSTERFHVDALGDVVAAVGTQWTYFHNNGSALPLFDTALPFDVDSGPGADLRAITNTSTIFSLTSTVQARRSGDGPVNFNELGQLVFGLQFEDGSRGIFLASPVPEPASAVLALFGAVALSMRRKRF